MARPAPLTEVQPLPASGSGPLYRQVKRELQRQIESGRYTPGDTLPSESFKVSDPDGIAVDVSARRDQWPSIEL